jgi:hypothetical protein
MEHIHECFFAKEERAIMQDSRGSSSAPTQRPSGTRGNIAIFSIIALALVIFGSVILLRTHTQPGVTTTPSQASSATVTTLTCQGSQLGCHAKPGLIGISAPNTDQGITMQVTDAYLDAISTTITVTVSSVTTQLGAVSVMDGTVNDSQGHVVPPFLAGSSGQIINSYKVNLFYSLLPLSDTQLRQQQQFVFTAHHLTTNIGKPLPGLNDSITGSWRLAFTVNPALGTEYQIQAKPVTIQGVAFVVNSLEVAPSTVTGAKPSDAGGVRIVLTATNVPAGTLPESFGAWYPTTGPRFTSCPSNGCPPRPGPTSAVLALPGFRVGDAPNGISSILTPASTAETVGPTGLVQFELLYPGSGTVTGADGTLTVTNFHLFTSLTPTPADLQETPAWHLPIPLHG